MEKIQCRPTIRNQELQACRVESSIAVDRRNDPYALSNDQQAPPQILAEEPNICSRRTETPMSLDMSPLMPSTQAPPHPVPANQRCWLQASRATAVCPRHPGGAHSSFSLCSMEDENHRRQKTEYSVRRPIACLSWFYRCPTHRRGLRSRSTTLTSSVGRFNKAETTICGQEPYRYRRTARPRCHRAHSAGQYWKSS